MPAPVKISDQLLALAKEEARSTNRSATAQIEHWATLGRAIEVLLTYRDMLSLKRAGTALPIPPLASPGAIEDALQAFAEETERESTKDRIRSSGFPIYEADPEDPARVVEIREDGSRRTGTMEGRSFVPAGSD